jgi:hypothetical protein
MSVEALGRFIHEKVKTDNVPGFRSLGGEDERIRAECP